MWRRHSIMQETCDQHLSICCIGVRQSAVPPMSKPIPLAGSRGAGLKFSESVGSIDPASVTACPETASNTPSTRQTAARHEVTLPMFLTPGNSTISEDIFCLESHPAQASDPAKPQSIGCGVPAVVQQVGHGKQTGRIYRLPALPAPGWKLATGPHSKAARKILEGRSSGGFC